MSELKTFRKVNNLLQKDVADYLGVSREYISMVESGKASLPYNHLRKLLVNDRGWDVSSLSDVSAVKEERPVAPGRDSIRGNNFSIHNGEPDTVSRLLSLLEKKDSQIDELLSQNRELVQVVKQLSK